MPLLKQYTYVWLRNFVLECYLKIPAAARGVPSSRQLYLITVEDDTEVIDKSLDNNFTTPPDSPHQEHPPTQVYSTRALDGNLYLIKK